MSGTYWLVPSVFVARRSALGAGASVSVAEVTGLVFVVPAGTLIVAVLTSGPVAVETTGALIVKVAVPPTARSNVAVDGPRLPEPEAGPLEPEPV